jgi:hypothetical protein
MPGLHFPVIFHDDEFRCVLLIFYVKNLGRAATHNILNLFKKSEWRTRIENLHYAIAVSLAKDLGTG